MVELFHQVWKSPGGTSLGLEGISSGLPAAPLGTTPLGHSLTAHLQGAPFTLLLLMICVLIRTIFLQMSAEEKALFLKSP